MARVAGRNRAMSWVAGVFCTGVIVALLWFALPMAPGMLEFFGDALRTVAPATP